MNVKYRVYVRLRNNLLLVATTNTRRADENVVRNYTDIGIRDMSTRVDNTIVIFAITEGTDRFGNVFNVNSAPLKLMKY